MENIIKKLICTYENVLTNRICDNIINKLITAIIQTILLIKILIYHFIK